MPKSPRPEEVKKATGLRLAAVRHALGLDQGDVAGEIGVTQGSMSNWETGTRLADPLAMIRFCDRYAATMDWIYRNQLGTLPADLAKKVQIEHAKLLLKADNPAVPTRSRRTV